MTSTDPSGAITKYAYDPVGNLVSTTDPAGSITTHNYDKNKRQTGTTNALGHTSTVQYDPVGNVILSIDALGNETRFFYDALNRKIGHEDAQGKTTIFDYDANNNLVQTTDPKGNITIVEYDMENRPVKNINALGKEALISYYPTGRVNEKTSAKGVITKMVYDDPSGQITSIIQAKDNSEETITTFSYDDNGLLEQETNALGIATSYIRDALGRIVSKRTGLASDGTLTLPLGSDQAIEEFFTYYPLGQVKTHTDPKSLITSFEYDGAGNKTKETDPLNNITTYEYDSNNNLISVLYPEGVTHSYEYDALNRMIVKDEQGVETRMAYNANNQVITRTNGNFVDTAFVYDSLGRLIEKTQGLLTPDQTTSRFGYDSNSNIVYVTNGLDKTVFYQYDELNRRILETRASDIDPQTFDPDNIDYTAFTASQKVRYNADNTPDQVTKADNSNIHYTYDNLNRVTQIIHNTRLEQEFAYDDLSRMTESRDYNRNQHTQTVEYLDYNLYQQHTAELQNTRRVETVYDNNANLTNLLYPSGKSITRTYTDNNQLETLANGSLILADIIQYNGLGSIKQMTLGNGMDLSFDYDTHNREIQRTCTKGTDLYTHEITSRDDQGNILDESITSSLGTVQKTHTYDNLDRLTGSSVTNGPSLSWTYDLEGNWTTTNQNGTPETRTVDNDNQYISITGQSPVYDANGNMTAYNGLTYVYDWANRLVQVKQGAAIKLEYFYDARNRRVKSLDATSGPAVAIEYIYHDSQVIEEYKDGGLDKTFVYADYIDDPIVMTSGVSRYYYIKDRQFSIKAITDETGSIVESYAYSAYGVMTIFDNQNTEIAGSAIGNPYGYTGRRLDAYTGLWYYRNRMYSPTLGRFMQKDPAGFVDGLNLYAYVLNNPLRYTDPDGLMARAAWDATADAYNWTTQKGAEATQWYADQYNETGEWYYAAGGLVSSLWTPETAHKTALTLGGGYVAGVAAPALPAVSLESGATTLMAMEGTGATGIKVTTGFLATKGTAVGVSYLGIQAATHTSAVTDLMLGDGNAISQPLELGKDLWDKGYAVNKAIMKSTIELNKPIDFINDALGVAGIDLLNFNYDWKGNYDPIGSTLFSQEAKWSWVGKKLDSNVLKNIGQTWGVAETGYSIYNAWGGMFDELKR